MSKFALIKCYHNGINPVLVGRSLETGVKGDFTIPNFSPYFYVEDESHGMYQSVDGKKLRKVTCERPGDVPIERAKYPKTYEADLLFARRYLIDKEIKSGFEVDGIEVKPISVDYSPYVLYLDLESYPHGDEPDMQKDFITSVALADSRQNKIATITSGLNAGSEKDLLLKLSAILTETDADAICAWSTYDHDMLRARFGLHNINFNFGRTNFFDLLNAYKNLFNKVSYALKDVSYEEGLTKEKQPQLDYRKLFDDDKKELRRINCNHTRWIRNLDKKYKITDYFWELRNFCGLESMENTLYSSVLIDTLLLREYNHKYVLPTKERHEKVPYEGAIVLEPKRGIYHGLAVFDMSHYYPQVLQTENLGPECHYGISQEKSILAATSEKLMDIREKLKKEHPLKYAAVKAIHNALYGVLASPNFRLYIPEIAARITEVARKGLKFIIDKVDDKGYKIVFGDTDSIAVEIDKDKAEELLIYLNNELKSFGEGYELKFEKYFTRFCCLGQKKRYFGEVEGRDRLEIKGFEEVRSDSAKLTKIVQEKIMRLVLEEDRQGTINYLKEVSNNFDNYSYEDIAIPRGLSRNLDEYRIDVDYIRGAKWVKSKYKVDMKAGDKVWYIYTHQPVDTVTVPEIEMFNKVENLEINRNRMVQRCITKPVENLIGILDISWSEIEGQIRLL